MAEKVPITGSLSEVYPVEALEAQKIRWEGLVSAFKQKWSSPPAFISRSPGRVNIIGEHIDYSLYSVLPMAITADVLIAVLPLDTNQLEISVSNVSPKFAEHSFPSPSPGEDITIDPSEHNWTNYFKAGFRGAVQMLREKRGDALKPFGLRVMVDGTVPSGSGLSSSAALVCSSALAVLHAYGEETTDKTELVELAIVSERAVGVNSGGMDQAASVFSLRDNAVYVSFFPSLHFETIQFPQLGQDLIFLVAQSLVVSDKAVSGPVCYNLRVVECTLAALWLAKKLGLKDLPEDHSPLKISLRTVQNEYFLSKLPSSTSPPFETQLHEMLDLVNTHLPSTTGYTREEIASVLSIPVSELEERYTTAFPIRATHFKLRQRAIHVFSEALRVQKFLFILRSPPKDASSILPALGDVMNASQESCRELYECSCPELDSLCDIARGAGAVGSRLTGAGWGGCSVHLVPEERVEGVKEALVKGFYKDRCKTQKELDEALVLSKPGGGSCIFKGDELGWTN